MGLLGLKKNIKNYCVLFAIYKENKNEFNPTFAKGAAIAAT